MYYTQEQIDRANQADLVSFLQGRGEQLTRAGQEYRWKRHDSLTIRGNKWYRHSQSTVSYTHLDVYKRQPLECIILTVNNDFMDAGGYAHEQLQ